MQRSMIGLAVLAGAFVFGGAARAGIAIDMVSVGNAGNAADNTGFGTVGYNYRIGKYEVTAGQYTAFLNAVANTTDTYGLFNTEMSRTDYGSGITRTGNGTVANPYIYTVAADFINRPVNYVSWGDSARFANWLHNGQPTGPEDLLTTEDGAYFLNGAVTNEALLAIDREADWKWAITSEDEWYKAAYYKGGGTSAGYWSFPTASDTAPSRDMNDASGNNANSWDSTGLYPYPIDSGKYTTVVGEFQNSASPYGTFDQGGNVWEWNEAITGWEGSSRGSRGIAFDVESFYMAASNRRWSVGPAYESADIGFRVANSGTVPEPTTLITWSVLGGMGAIVGWRRRCKRAA